jgi:hypothetical protein
MLGDDGSLQAFSTRDLGATASPSPTPTATPRGKRTPEIVMASSSPRPVRQPEAIPEPISETAALLVAAAAEGRYPRTWTHTLAGSSVPYVLSLSRTDANGSSTFIADGGGSGNQIHIEATIRNGQFTDARGTLRVVTSDMDQTQTLTTVWSIAPS